MSKARLLVFCYILIVLTPLVISIVRLPETHNSFLYELGRAFALIGIMIITMQVVLAARIKWIEKHFGFDMVLRYHRTIIIFGTVLIILHPVLLAFGGGGLRLLINTNLPWYIMSGKAVLVLMFLNVLAAVSQRLIKIDYERWRVVHDIMAVLLIAGIFAHSGFAGRDIERSGLLSALWIIIPCLASALFIYHRFVRPYMLGKRPYRVEEVKQEANSIWTIKMSPPQGTEVPEYAPGQFQFITFHRGRKLPVEEHHWTISSDPADKKMISATIKDLGDFTSGIKDTLPGDTADIQMPFGRFSYIHHKPKNGFVFIAGGIGITPFISMLRHMNSTGSTQRVLLLYANRDEDDIPFYAELKSMEKSGHPSLKVVNFLKWPGKNWAGETGHIDGEKILKHCGNDLTGRMFLASGQEKIVKSALDGLKQAGVPDENMDIEIFSLLD